MHHTFFRYRHTDAEGHIEEISGVAFIFNQKFFNDLNEAKGINLENIVYYKDETHYFVMTAKKQSLIDKGVIKENEADTEKLLSMQNINQDKLFEYAREAADYATDYKMPHLDFAVNHYGKPDVAMFDFTSMFQVWLKLEKKYDYDYGGHLLLWLTIIVAGKNKNDFCFQAENSCRVIERHGHRLLTSLVGDSLLEPFWPTGTGCARGFFGGLDACWLMRTMALGNFTTQIATAFLLTFPAKFIKKWTHYCTRDMSNFGLFFRKSDFMWGHCGKRVHLQITRANHTCQYFQRLCFLQRGPQHPVPQLELQTFVPTSSHSSGGHRQS